MQLCGKQHPACMVRNHHQNSSTVAEKSLLIMCSHKTLTTPHHRGVVGYLFAQGACKRLQVRTTAHGNTAHGKAHNFAARYRRELCLCLHFPSGSFRYISTVRFGPTNYITKPPAGLLDLLAPSHAFHHPPSAKHPQSHCGIMLASPVASGGTGAERHRPTPPKSEMISRVQRTGKELGSRKRIIAYHYANNNIEAKLFGIKHMPMKINILYSQNVVILPGYAYCT